MAGHSFPFECRRHGITQKLLLRSYRQKPRGKLAGIYMGNSVASMSQCSPYYRVLEVALNCASNFDAMKSTFAVSELAGKAHGNTGEGVKCCRNNAAKHL
jgi:hypothetical protein